MHHFQGEFGGRTTLFWRHGELPSWFTPHYVCMLLDHSFIACIVLMFIMPYAMFISAMTCMISIETPMFI